MREREREREREVGERERETKTESDRDKHEQRLLVSNIALSDNDVIESVSSEVSIF